MSLLRNITRSGLSATDEYQKKRGILLANYISLILCGSIVVLFIVRRLMLGHISGGVTLYLLGVGIFFFAIPILVNRIGLTTAGRLLLCYCSVLFVWYAYVSLMKEMATIGQVDYDGLRIHLVTMSFIPYLVLDSKKPGLLIMGIVPTLISLLFFGWILSQLGVGITQQGLPADDAAVMWIRTFVAYGIISVSCYIFQAIITYNDELNKRILLELKSKSDQIKTQNEKLIQSQERLNDVNQHLEELVLQKTMSIQQQNKKILSYAFSNAHIVRAHIARILGLIQLARLEKDLDYPWFFEKVENETKQVDEITKGISKELNEIDHQAKS